MEGVVGCALGFEGAKGLALGWGGNACFAEGEGGEGRHFVLVGEVWWRGVERR